MSERKRIVAILCCLVLGAADLVYVNLQLVPLLGLDNPAPAIRAGESAKPEAGSQQPARFKVNRPVSRPVSEPDVNGRQEIARPEKVAPEASSSRQQPPVHQETGQKRSAIPARKPADDQKSLQAAARMKEEQGPRLRAALVLHFSPGKWEIDESHREKLNGLVEEIGDTNDLWVQIEGHTDPIAHSVLDNQRLSEARADAVAGFWVANGLMGPDRIETLAFGSSKPVDPNNHPDAWAKNRRSVIRVFKGKP